MTPLLEVTLRASTVLGAALVIVELIPRRSAAARHALVAGAILCSAVAVAASRILPEWHVPLAWTTARAVASPPRGGVCWRTLSNPRQLTAGSCRSTRCCC